MSNIVKKNLDVVFIFLLMLLVFGCIMFYVGNSDLPAHANIALDMLNNNRLFSTNFLMYFCVNILTFFSGNIFCMCIVLVVLIALSNTLKYKFVKDELLDKYDDKIASLSSFTLLFVYIIPVFYFLKYIGFFQNTHNMYMGYFVPNVWHNSTILCMMPFAIKVFQLSVKQLKEYETHRNIKIALYLTISTLIKPSFFFIYMVAYPIVMLFRYGFSYRFFVGMLPVLIGCLCMLYEYFTIYMVATDESGVVISFSHILTCEFWKSHILYFLVSLAFPLLFLLLYRTQVCNDYEFWFVLLMLVSAIGISWCCVETGSRAMHGNFTWQVVSAMWFVYYYMLKIILRDDSCELALPNTIGGGIRSCVIKMVYSLHVLMGLVYLLRFLFTKNFG